MKTGYHIDGDKVRERWEKVRKIRAPQLSPQARKCRDRDLAERGTKDRRDNKLPCQFRNGAICNKHLTEFNELLEVDDVFCRQGCRDFEPEGNNNVDK